MQTSLFSLKSSVSLFVISTVISGGAFAGGLPIGGHFESGAGSIAKAGRSLTVKQSSTTGIIDWNNFSIGAKGSVRFDNGSGATLNRVTGANLSRIAGSLNATGSLYLMNANGTIVSSSGHVVTGGDFAISSGNFAGNAFGDDPRFKGAKAAIVNRGSIIAGGTATLSGSSVHNIGTISAARVAMRAEHGEALAAGSIAATGESARILVIARSGRTNVTGDLVARNSDGTGGTIETSGHRVSIAGKIDAGKGGTWLIDPVNLTVDSAAATTIDASLDAGTNVTLKTTASGASGPGTQSSGAGDIVIDSALSWSGDAKLTLDAYHGIAFDADVRAAGKGKLTLATNDGGTGGNYTFGTGDSVNFANIESALVINGASYTLVNNIAELAADIAGNASGDYALAKNYNAKSDGAYSASPIPTTFGGTFEGLGNTIANLTIKDIVQSPNYIGLFAYLEPEATLRDIGLTNVDVSAECNQCFVGGLVGDSNGTVTQSYVTGSIKGGKHSYIGGLAGLGATVSDSYATSAVKGGKSSEVGGLVGGGTIMRSYATGAVEGGDHSTVGGLAGSGSVIDSYATGSVTAGRGAWIGGLVGKALTISDSYATGSVAGGINDKAGGLAGSAEDAITQSYATGVVTAHGRFGYAAGLVAISEAAIIMQSYATGSAVSHGGGAGGLVGYNEGGSIIQSFATGAAKAAISSGGLVDQNNGTIKQSYATGAATAGENSSVGGLVGYYLDGAITQCYSTGEVKGGRGASIGGLIGVDYVTRSSISNSYWDTTTSGITAASQGTGNVANVAGIKGKTTAQLQAGLPKGFSSKVWAIDPNINNGLPYLIALASSY